MAAAQKLQHPMPKSSLLAVALVAGLLMPGVARAQQAPTLGDMALKEQARRQALKAAASRVLTNDDLPRGATSPAPAAAAAQAAAGEEPAASKKSAAGDKPAASDKPVEKSQEAPQDQASWKQRIDQIREELRRNQMFAEALQTRLNALSADFTARDDPYQRAQIAEQRSSVVRELDRVKADIDLNRKGIAEIEDEARRTGVPAGWLR
jgi:hypothetical protein